MIGYAICGSFCTHKKTLEILRFLAESNDIVPVLSFNSANTDTRFGTASELMEAVREICNHTAVTTLTEAEKFGSAIPLDAMIIAPCTGNTLAKIANGISDTPPTLAAKAHLRSDRPLLISLASNDAMSANLRNISSLLNRKNVFFVPMKQDDPVMKPHSLISDFEKIPKAYEMMLSGKQMRPLFG